MEFKDGNKYRVKTFEACANTPQLTIIKNGYGEIMGVAVKPHEWTLMDTLGKIITLKTQRNWLYSSREYGTNFGDYSFEESICE